MITYIFRDTVSGKFRSKLGSRIEEGSVNSMVRSIDYGDIKWKERQLGGGAGGGGKGWSSDVFDSLDS